MAVIDLVNLIVRAKIKESAITEPSIALAVEEVEQVIKNYCNIDAIPEELKYTWANMAADLAKYDFYLDSNNGDILDGFDSGDISSLKIGDTDIALQGNESAAAKKAALRSHRPNLDEIVMNNRAQLNRFRRMVW